MISKIPPTIYGAVIDEQTRCLHYHSVVDIVALKFPCCQRFYPCHACHAEDADHPAEQWPASASDELAVLCGNCHSLLSIAEYRSATHCPRCQAQFNPRCALHAEYYFAD